MIKPGDQVPALNLPLTNGARYDLAKQSPENFTLVVFYRGKHCPVCRSQLKDLASKLDEFSKRGVKVVAVSMDAQDRAMEVHEKWSTGDVPLAYDLSEANAREWGLYISSGRPDTDEPSVFSEPGMFLVRPDNTLYFASVQNAPFTRPPFDQLLQGLDYIIANDYPTRGMLT
ncbi:MAG: peroxiredoxin-like family protein [Pseudomonadota bacterium]